MGGEGWEAFLFVLSSIGSFGLVIILLVLARREYGDGTPCENMQQNVRNGDVHHHTSKAGGRGGRRTCMYVYHVNVFFPLILVTAIVRR